MSHEDEEEMDNLFDIISPLTFGIRDEKDRRRERRKPIYKPVLGHVIGIQHEGVGLTQIIQFTLMNDAFEAFGVWGRRGAGKTTCCLWLGHDIYTYLNPKEAFDQKKIWSKVLDSVVFKPEEYDKKIEEVDRRHGYKMYVDHKLRIPYLYWDDAGLHASAYFWHTKDLKYLGSFFDVMRTYVKIFIYSTPKVQGVMSSLRRVLTGEIYIPYSYYNRGIWRKGMFIKYMDVPNFYKVFEAYTIKRFINAFGREFIFPKLPKWVEVEYNKRKHAATEDLQIKRKHLELRKREIIKQIEEELMPFEKTLLQFINHRYGKKQFSIQELREDLAKHLHQAVTKHEVLSSLKVLRSMDLVIYNGEGDWLLSQKGLAIAEIWRKEEEEAIENLFPR